MKKILFLSLITLAVIGGILYFTNFAKANQSVENFFWRSACDRPIAIAIGNIDPKFNTTQKEFLSSINQASGIWKKSYGKDLFVVDPSAKLKINLVYDERQSLTTLIGGLEDKLNQDKSSLSPEINQFEQKAKNFREKLQKLNSEIDYWNKQGGAPPEEYNNILKQREDLQKEAEQLNADAKKLKLATENYNAKVGELNSTVKDFNQTISQKPEEGLYDPQGNKIDIYFIVNHDELVHTLAHELGHALGMGHNSNPKSIMYPQTTKLLTPTKEDLKDLEKVCQKQNLLELSSIRISQTLNFYQNQLDIK